tara:strand:- start:446 stop:712 length:267 start_codon:yes stop_codon:yes gene_type:complete
MSNYQSYREEKLKFYLKAIDVLRKGDPDMALDDLYSNAVKEAGLMWGHFSRSLADHKTLDWIYRNEEAGNPTPPDYEIYTDSLARRPR